jgi:phosphatidylserine decarboxylase
LTNIFLFQQNDCSLFIYIFMKIPLGSGFSLSIHEEGRIFVSISSILTAATILLGGMSSFALFGCFLTLAIAAFFRDPDRVTPVGTNLVISPADGKIVSISEEFLPLELGNSEQKCVKVSIFLSVFDVHVNRMPIAGKIVCAQYVSGKFFNASLDKASKQNERNAIMIETESGTRVGCVQIAGFVARRIVSDAEVGSFFATAQRYGIIKFGSRVDLYLPKSCFIDVMVGQLVIGGETIIARIA